jgi:hypothetical protein
MPGVSSVNNAVQTQTKNEIFVHESQVKRKIEEFPIIKYRNSRFWRQMLVVLNVFSPFLVEPV